MGPRCNCFYFISLKRKISDLGNKKETSQIVSILQLDKFYEHKNCSLKLKNTHTHIYSIILPKSVTVPFIT